MYTQDYNYCNLPFSFPKFSFDNTSFEFNFIRGSTVQKYFQYKNSVPAEILKLHVCCAIIYLYAALLYI